MEDEERIHPGDEIAMHAIEVRSSSSANEKSTLVDPEIPEQQSARVWSREDDLRLTHLKQQASLSAEEEDELSELEKRYNVFIEEGLAALHAHDPVTRKGLRISRLLLVAVVITGCVLAAILFAVLHQQGGDGSPPRARDKRRPLLVETAEGKVFGKWSHIPGVRRFLGIPYAKPPVGERRWRPPEEPEGWAGVRYARQFHTGCIDGSGVGDEDCLYLNVFAPVEHHSPLAVMYWIHGGCYTWGEGDGWGAAFKVYHGDHLAKAGNVVVVTAEYRLGALGFLGSDHLRNRDERYNSTGNYGIQDQRMVLKWIQRNIELFGGDRTRVMIFGQSSGAGSVAVHLISPHSSGLFHRAALQSGSFPNWITHSASAAKTNFQHLARVLNCSGSPNEVVECLLLQDAGVVARAGIQKSSEVPCRDGCAWAPMIDGVEVADVPWRLLENTRNHNVVPIINMFCKDDGVDFVEDTRKLRRKPNKTEWMLWVNGTFERPKHNLAARMEELYNHSRYEGATTEDFNSLYLAASQAETDFAYLCPARRTARHFAKHNVGSYLGEFARVYPPELQREYYDGQWPFAEHSCELYHLFGSNERLSTPDDRWLADLLMSYWTNFAKEGDPNGVDSSGKPLPRWESNKDGEESMHTLRIRATKVEMVAGLEGEQCDFWDKHWDYFGRCLPQPGNHISTCTTPSGDCVFPYGIGNVTFYQCLAHNVSHPWCPTAVDSAGNPQAKGHCPTTCRATTKAPPAQAHPSSGSG